MIEIIIEIIKLERMSLRHAQTNGFQLSQSVSKGRDVYWRNYQTDGYGRDQYIQGNNGGMNSSFYQPAKGISIGRGLYVGNN